MELRIFENMFGNFLCSLFFSNPMLAICTLHSQDSASSQDLSSACSITGFTNLSTFLSYTAAGGVHNYSILSHQNTVSRQISNMTYKRVWRRKKESYGHSMYKRNILYGHLSRGEKENGKWKTDIQTHIQMYTVTEDKGSINCEDLTS